MKSPVPVLPFLVLLALPLVDSVAADEGLDRLRASYQAAVARAMQAPRENYAKELNRVIETRTRRSDLEGAVAAHKALGLLTSDPGENEEGGTQVADEELDRLRSGYEEASGRALKPLRETYLRELNKILQARTQASDLPGALAVKNEIESVEKETRQKEGDPIETYFVGRTWVSQSGTAFTFAEDGGCLRETGQRREGTWKRRGDVVISSIEGSPQETRYFRFVSKTEGYYGNSEDKIEMPVLPK
jgi:hypothetical protein